MVNKKSLIKKAKDLLGAYEKKRPLVQYADRKHYHKMIEYGTKVKEGGFDFDFDVYEIAVWLHDIGHHVADDKAMSKDYDRKMHKTFGYKIFEEQFKKHIGDSELEEKIGACIKYHSEELNKEGRRYLEKHPELQVIREADRASFLHPEFTENLLKYKKHDGVSEVEELIERNYNEVMNSIVPSKYGKKIIEKWKSESYGLIERHKRKGG